MADYLVRLARALCWSECTAPPVHGSDTTILAETLLERAERLGAHHDGHTHSSHDHHPTHHHSLKLRRERSCHDLPLKETSAMYSLQRRVRVLREQVQRRDLHLELLRRKLALLEDTARGKCIVQVIKFVSILCDSINSTNFFYTQNERDEAIHRARRTVKTAERTAQQLCDAKAQLVEIKAQLAEAADYKVRARRYIFLCSVRENY